MLGFNGGNYQLVGLFYCDKYSRETTIQGRKLLISRTFLVRQLFKGDNYSREETIRGNTVCHTYVPLQLELSLISTASFLQLLQQIPTQSIFH